MLGGSAAKRLVADGVPATQRYWLRVWAARGLVWAGTDDAAVEALGHALDDESWRVREMACKVVARHRVGDLLDAVSDLRADPIARVRAAATRAAEAIIEAGA